jgi:hypothetical protein
MIHLHVFGVWHERVVCFVAYSGAVCGEGAVGSRHINRDIFVQGNAVVIAAPRPPVHLRPCSTIMPPTFRHELTRNNNKKAHAVIASHACLPLRLFACTHAAVRDCTTITARRNSLTPK